MNTANQQEVDKYFENKLMHAKNQFERALDCKYTEFDDLYPYMNEHPQFFWYKRYVAWQELLTVVEIAADLNVSWQKFFTKKQIAYIENKILEGKVLDHWYEEDESMEKQNR